MESAQKVYQRIAQTRSLVEEALLRAQSAPFPKSDRIQRIQEVRDAAHAAMESAEQTVRVLEGPAKEPLERTQATLQGVRDSIGTIDRQVQDIQQQVAARKRLYQAALAAAQAQNADAAAQSKITNDWNKDRTDLDLQAAQLTSSRTTLATEMAELSARINQEQIITKRSADLAMQQPAPIDLLAADGQMSSVLERAGLLEKEMVVGATAQLQQEVKNRLGEKTADFTEAENYHKDQATKLLLAMAASVTISTIAGDFSKSPWQRVHRAPAS